MSNPNPDEEAGLLEELTPKAEEQWKPNWQIRVTQLELVNIRGTTYLKITPPALPATMGEGYSLRPTLIPMTEVPQMVRELWELYDRWIATSKGRIS